MYMLQRLDQCLRHGNKGEITIQDSSELYLEINIGLGVSNIWTKRENFYKAVKYVDE
jgi:hypothetical protein